jgi:hypothetical protein
VVVFGKPQASQEISLMLWGKTEASTCLNLELVVKALCYKLEGRGFDSRWGEFLNLPNPSGHTRLWGLLSL